MTEEISGDYGYNHNEADHTQAYLWSGVIQALKDSGAKRVFDLGCGNGAFARYLSGIGYEVQGVDPSVTGIEQANLKDPSLMLEIGSAYDPLVSRFGTFQSLVSLEVVEHVYYPRIYARCVADMLESGGTAIISTPYHSYLKNLALALSGKMDAHFTALWDHGHIKFWSVKTLTELFAEQGLTVEKVLRVGRIPVLGKSMILILRKP